MKAEALALIENVPDPALKLNLLREYLQTLVLLSLHESKAFQSLSFVGGTSLRFLYGLRRFSEDLDFSLEQSGQYDLQRWLGKIRRDLEYAGFSVTVTANDRKNVHVAWVRTAELLQAAGLAAVPRQNLSIKLEIDTHPPAGAGLENTIVNRRFAVLATGDQVQGRSLMFAVRHHDLPSLLSGKIHALCTRQFLKGRDWYDLVWFRTLQTPRLQPNLVLLQNALDQTRSGWKADQWSEGIKKKLDLLDQEALRRDVGPFLEQHSDLDWLTKENIRQVL